MPATSVTDEVRVDAVRSFNRFYTRVIGLLREGLLSSPYSLTEARVIFELAQREPTDLSELRRALGMDAGQLSRVVGRLEESRLLARERSREDRRRQLVRLTRKGRGAFETLDRRSAAEVGALLERLGEDEQRRLLDSMAAIQEILGDSPPPAPFVVREPEPGDFGWIVERHGALYAEEYGWDERFETLVARIVAEHAAAADPSRERTWIAELGGRRAGCVMCVAKDERVARLRLLLVEPWARGMGIGARLVDECIRFARAAGYEEMVLWTNDVLAHARPIYERAGFELVGEQPHADFGKRVVGQTWSRPL